jgi:hypothetical protein
MVDHVGANGLIGTIGALLDDCLLGNIVGIFSKKIFKKIFLNMYYLVKVCVLIFSQKYVIFKDFQLHLQVLLLLKNNDYKFFYITFEGPNVNETISYFGHL